MLNSRINRAVQFQPFDALKGFKEALKEVERIHEEKKTLSEDSFKELDNTLKSLKRGDIITIEYYYDLTYLELTGTIRKIDSLNRKLYLSQSIISFDDIVAIKKDSDFHFI